MVYSTGDPCKRSSTKHQEAMSIPPPQSRATPAPSNRIEQPLVQRTAGWLCVALAVVIGGSYFNQRNRRSDGQQAAPPAVLLRLDLNLATAEELALLPGLGPVTARKIIEDRAQFGDFTAVDDLARIRGIGPATVTQVEPFLQVETEAQRQVLEESSAVNRLLEKRAGPLETWRNQLNIERSEGVRPVFQQTVKAATRTTPELNAKYAPLVSQ